MTQHGGQDTGLVRSSHGLAQVLGETSDWRTSDGGELEEVLSEGGGRGRHAASGEEGKCWDNVREGCGDHLSWFECVSIRSVSSVCGGRHLILITFILFLDSQIQTILVVGLTVLTDAGVVVEHEGTVGSNLGEGSVWAGVRWRHWWTGVVTGLVLVTAQCRAALILCQWLAQTGEDVVVLRLETLALDLVELVDKTLEARSGEGEVVWPHLTLASVDHNLRWYQ